MKMKTFVILMSIFLISQLSGCFLQAQTKINADIKSNVKSAKQIIEACSPYVNKYLGENKYHLGEIQMALDENHKGKVELYYAEKSSTGNPKVVEIDVDTTKNKILLLDRLGNDSKLDPGEINFSKWKLDSINAYEKTLNLFSSDPKFKFNKVKIYTSNAYEDNLEVWEVLLHDSVNRNSYWSIIDPYTGKVYGHGIRKF